MSHGDFRVIRYRPADDEGARNGILVGEGPKWIKVIVPDCRGLRVTQVPVQDAKFITTIDAPVKRALETLKVMARHVGCLQSAAEVLGIKPIEPPRDPEMSGPTPKQMKQEFANMARSIPKGKKATDKKPRVARAPSDKSTKVAGPTTLAREAAVAYIKQHRLTPEKLADREVSAAVKAAMVEAAPTAAHGTIQTQFSNVKRAHADAVAAKAAAKEEVAA